MAVFRVIVVARAIQIGGHGADGVKTILFAIGLAHLDARDFGQSVGVVGWFQRPCQQVLFLDGLRAQLGVNARRPKKQQLFAAVAVCAVDNVVLDLQVLVNELCGICGIGVDASHLGGGQNHHVRSVLGKKSPHPGLIAQIQFCMRACELPFIARTRQGTTQGAAYKPPVARHIDQSIFAHCLTRCG